MNCRDNETQLLAERDGGLTSGQRATLERHVATCPACRQLRARLAEALGAFQADAANVAVPDANEAWRDLRAQLHDEAAKPVKKRPLAPIIWFSIPLAATAALTLAWLGLRSPSAEPFAPAAPAAEVARADFVEAGDASASTMVYVDKDSGWLVVWATDGDAHSKG
ncbi:MAG TPA: zf-HC2 domain-containing protein [Lacunisphaera sp.]|nr:zf-HC2 domain-containing protein [Lacunisphaera sp.]